MNNILVGGALGETILILLLLLEGVRRLALPLEVVGVIVLHTILSVNVPLSVKCIP